jgi:alkylation response protein AidB-like acyl-CoA dehydrogenase
VQQIEMLNGSKEFCQEFLTDVRVPDTDRIGDVDDGWTVGTRWMFHERMLHNSPLVSMPAEFVHGRHGLTEMLGIARGAGRMDDPLVRDLLGEVRMLEVVRESLQRRVAHGVATRTLPDHASGIARLFHGVSGSRIGTIGFEIAGGLGSAWTADDGGAALAGPDFLMRQTSCIGGGTTEMARNVISERVLGMPRERSGDRDVPFRDVPRSASH